MAGGYYPAWRCLVVTLFSENVIPPRLTKFDYQDPGILENDMFSLETPSQTKAYLLRHNLVFSCSVSQCTQVHLN